MTFHSQTLGFDILTISKGATLIVPAVSSGNVAQLTLDLLLSTLPNSLIGRFHSGNVLPCVGSNAFDAPINRKTKKHSITAAPPASLVTALELYSIPSLNVLVLQQRSPTILGRAAAFVQELTNFATQIQVSRFILLTSSLAFRQQDQDLDAIHPISFFLTEPITSNSTSPLAQLLKQTLQWNSLHFNPLQQDERPLDLHQLNGAEEENDPLAAPKQINKSKDESKDANDDDDEKSSSFKPIPVPGLGITRPLYDIVTSASVPSFTSLFLHTYVNEGANDRDAMMMAQNLYTLLFVMRQEGTSGASASSLPAPVSAEKLLDPREIAWRVPSSWNALFGNEPEESMYL